MPTQAQVQTTIGDLVRILDECLSYCAVNSQRFTGTATNHEGTFRAGLQSDYTYHQAMTAGVEAHRSRLNQVIQSGADVLGPALLEFGKVIGAPETDLPTLFRRLSDYFAVGAGGPYTIKSRAFTFATPAASGSPVGNGIINRLNTDQYNYSIENQTPDKKTAIIARDENSGASKHEEEFELRGADPARDFLVIQGSGKVGRLKALSARDSLGFISNPSFSDFSGTTALPTAISGWTVALGTLGTDIQMDQAIYYRDFDGDTTPTSVKFIHNGAGVSLSQKFDVRRVQILGQVPMYFQVAVNKGTATAGTIVFQVGAVQQTINVTALSAGWNIVRLATGLSVGGNNNNWYRQFKNTGAQVIVSTPLGLGGAGQVIYFDDIIFAPFTFFDGGWYAAIGGTTKWLRDDAYTWTDTATDAARIQRWLWRAFGTYLPSTTGTPTWLDPT